MDYNIRIELDEKFDEHTASRAIDVMQPFHPGPARSILGRLEVTITIPADDLFAAAVTGYRVASPLGSTIVALEVLRTADFDRINGLEQVPELINAVEAAELLGMSAAAVGQKFTAGELPGQRVGERTIVFARRDIQAIAEKRGGVRRTQMP